VIPHERAVRGLVLGTGWPPSVTIRSGAMAPVTAGVA
jgi:hypothetical protein